MKYITVTLNPALDMTIECKEPLNLTGLNRSDKASFSPGGKGINVSRALKAFGKDSDCICVLGGFTGAKIRDMLDKEGVTVRCVSTTAETRLNISVMTEGHQCEINNPPCRPKDAEPIGEGIRPAEETAEILKKVQALIHNLVYRNGDEKTFVFLAGSLPPDMPTNTYADLIEKIHSWGAYAICDCDGEALRKSLTATPDYIKPNLEELSLLTERRLTKEQIPSAASEVSVTTGGYTAVIVTAGSNGAYIVRGKNPQYVPSVKLNPEEIHSLKGAGDTFIAAFILARYEKQISDIQALRFAAGVAAKKIRTPDSEYPDLRDEGK